jgi:hypothetical protein
MHKKDALTAGQTLLNIMGKLYYKNSDFNVCDAGERLSGERNITVSPVASTGSGYGLQRTARSGYYLSFPATASLLLIALRITGLNEFRKSILTFLKSDIWFMMQPIFIRMVVC